MPSWQHTLQHSVRVCTCCTIVPTVALEATKRGVRLFKALVEAYNVYTVYLHNTSCLEPIRRLLIARIVKQSSTAQTSSSIIATFRSRGIFFRLVQIKPSLQAEDTSKMLRGRWKKIIHGTEIQLLPEGINLDDWLRADLWHNERPFTHECYSLALLYVSGTEESLCHEIS